MTKPVHTSRFAPALFALVLTLTGCGGSDEADGVPETTRADVITTPSTTEASTTTAVIPATTTTEPASDVPGPTRVLLPGSESPRSASFPTDTSAALFVGDDGRPRVVYVSGSNMIVMAVCENAACAEVETHTVADISPLDITNLEVVGFTGDGRPMAAYSALDPTVSGDQPPQFGVAWCDDPDCIETDSTAPDRDCVDADCDQISVPGQLGNGPSFATSPDGRRYLATWSNGIILVDCSDQYCPPTPDDLVLTDPEMGQPVLGFTPAGNALLVLEESVSSGGAQPPRTNVWLATCSDPTCDQPPHLARVFDTEPGVYVQVEPPLVTDTGLAIILNAFSPQGSEFAVDDLPDRVIVIGCDDHICTNPVVTTVATGIRGAVATLGPDQLPRVAWADPNQRVSYARCDDPACTTYTTEPLSGAGQVRALTATAEATLLVTESSAALHLNICPADNCLN